MQRAATSHTTVCEVVHHASHSMLHFGLGLLNRALHENACCSAGANGKSVTYYTSCTSNLFAWNAEQESASSNKQGMVCPGLLVSRPASVTNSSLAYYNNVVSSDPLLYSYQNCTCVLPLVAHYTFDTAGMSWPQMHFGEALSTLSTWIADTSTQACVYAGAARVPQVVVLDVCMQCCKR